MLQVPGGIDELGAHRADVRAHSPAHEVHQPIGLIATVSLLKKTRTRPCASSAAQLQSTEKLEDPGKSRG